MSYPCYYGDVFNETIKFKSEISKTVHLAKKFQRRRFLEIDQAETKFSNGAHAG